MNNNWTACVISVCLWFRSWPIDWRQFVASDKLIFALCFSYDTIRRWEWNESWRRTFILKTPRSYDRLIPTNGAVFKVNEFIIVWTDMISGLRWRWEIWNSRVLFKFYIFYSKNCLFLSLVFVGFCLNSYLSLSVLQQFFFSKMLSFAGWVFEWWFYSNARWMIFRFIYFQLIDRFF